MKKLSFIALILLAVSCSKETSNFTLKGHIKGLKKGTVFLEKAQDSTFTILDSLAINGNPDFELHSHLEEPEVLFLRLNKNDVEEGIISFFADKGITEISTTLKNFNFDAKINGSEQQKLLDEYLTMMSKFNNKNLELIKENFDSKKDNDTTNFDIESQYNNLLRRKYLYTINFAVTHSSSEVAPYLAISEIANANTQLLDTIYKSLEDNIKTTLYGKKLKEIIDERKQ